MADGAQVSAGGRRIALIDHAPSPTSFREALRAGLSGSAKAIPYWFLYDQHGSELFDRICTLPEYYPTRTELGLLHRHAAEIASEIGPDADLIELGSGSSVKVRILLDALDRPAAYVPIDISREHLVAAAQGVQDDYPRLKVTAVCADYGQPFRLPAPTGQGRAGFYPGSTIGNLEPEQAQAFLAAWAERLGPGGRMIVGVDLPKDAKVLEAAYDDAQGVTASFTLNVLARANRELGTDFRLDGFTHEARYDAQARRVVIHLRSLADQVVTLDGQVFEIARGEGLHLENCYKYAVADFAALAHASGFESRRTWVDPDGLFSLHSLVVA